MSENATVKVTNLIIVTEQLEQIDTVEKALKEKLALNTYTTNNIIEVKKILSKENVEVVVIDDDDSTIGIGSVRNAVTELKLNTPVLQLVHDDVKKTNEEFIKNGATLVCPANDKYAILHNTELLIDYVDGQSAIEKGVNLADDYREKFNDLYQGLADPVCYLLDGIFLDCNPAFLRAFEVSEKDELDELTILNFIDRKHQNELKTHLRKSTRRDLSANPVLFTMQTKLGNAAEYTVMSKPVKFDDDDAVQVYMRSTADGGGGSGAALFDESTGLSNREQMGFFLTQKIQQFADNDGKAILVYLLIRNYRDVWGADGFSEAEKFIKAIAVFARKVMPAHTEASRYTDDGLLFYIPTDDEKEVDRLLTELIKDLDKLTPEGMERMVEPSCYSAFTTFNKESDYLKEISALFRVSRSASLTEGARVSQPTANEVAKKDTQRIELLQNMLKNESMQMLFQPIASFDPDGGERYRERIRFIIEENEENEENEIELDVLINAAERYQLMHLVDKWKMNQLFNRLLGMGVEERANLNIFVTLSVDSLKNTGFCDWLVEQLKHTGLGGKHFVFEMMVDNVVNAYSGALRFAKALRESGAQIAVSKVGALTPDNQRIVNDIVPNFIKLDLREIDTLDENEEAEVMGDLRTKADEINATLIAEYLESPAQLSRIWPYDVKFIQGEGMTPVLDDLSFNFGEFAI